MTTSQHAVQRNGWHIGMVTPSETVGQSEVGKGQEIGDA